ncbi:MAG: thiol reductant ABC exporter subunit CydC [Acidocella sp. 20-57-95]|nr:MAG: thiol reductant ABC exporter subunit CydC [Acidocella sp. 20-57-95]OYV60475.1 MAG: thiol reductant ABC exporter subunit CydC [Acidocella sp. 21-58-7]HQT64731.1 thiol reductant ABC exporter subunit CydC [Acidocella sp.]HQU04729.1 thiol reductant ABC exporter subunit CydC [Acidocella sp.]
MIPVMKILRLWQAHYWHLALGALLALAALAAGIALMQNAGLYTATAVLGGVLLVPVALQMAGVARVVLRYLERLVSHDAMFRALGRVRVWFFTGLANSAAGGLGLRRAGDALARLVNDVEALDGLYLRIIVPGLAALMLLPVLLVVLSRENGWALLVIFPFAVIALVLPWQAAALAGDNAKRVSLAMAGLRNAALDTLSGLREVKIFAAEGRMLALVQARESALLAAQRELAQRVSRLNIIGFITVQAGILLVLLLGFMSGPVASAVALFVAVAAFEAVSAMPRAGVLLGQSRVAAARVVEAAEAGPTVPDPAAPPPPLTGYAVSFEHVGFRYAHDLPFVFENLSLQLPAGSRTAILGPSGAGKSTIAGLLLKLAAPQSGKIKLGTVDIAALPAEAVRSKIAYLSQTTHLFADTIRNNLLLGDPSADEARLWAALESAQLAGVVRALPNGLDEWLGEGGNTLSGGQGRRLALARTLLSQAPILLLDEPCAGLDAATEAAFFETLNHAVAGRTLVLIAHRLTGVEKLDRIWRLAGGSLVAAAG